MEKLQESIKVGVEKLVSGRWIMTVGVTGLIISCTLLKIPVPEFIIAAWGLMVGLYFTRTDRN